MVWIEHQLGDAVVIAQVNEEQAPMVSDPVYPARKADGFTHLGFGELATGVTTKCMHGHKALDSGEKFRESIV